jgi:hypothetical protein
MRSIGLELEICGQTWKQGEEIANEVSWRLHLDGSIPKKNLKRKCECVKVAVCGQCSQKQENCKCCSCSFRCSTNCYVIIHVGSITSHFRGHAGDVLRCYACGTTRTKAQFEKEVEKHFGKNKKNCACASQSKWDQRKRLPECECTRRVPGYELVSPVIRNKGRLKENLAKIFKGLRENARLNGVRFYASHARSEHSTGFHVHLDAGNLRCNYYERSPERDARLVVLALYIQDHWDELAAKHPRVLRKHRKNNVYARFFRTVRGHLNRKVEELYRDVRQSDRYQTVNFEAMSKHGTIEFRSGYVPTKAEDAYAWAMFLHDLVETVNANSFIDLTVSEAYTKLNALLYPAPVEVPELIAA